MRKIIASLILITICLSGCGRKGELTRPEYSVC